MYVGNPFIEGRAESMAQNVEAPLAGDREHDVITIVLTADNHLGCTGSRNRSPFVGHPHMRKREDRLQRLRRAFQQATDFAVGQGVDLFIQAGDLFDTPTPSEEDRSFVAARLAELRQASIRTFAVSGVHDTPVDRGYAAGDAGSMASLSESSAAPSPGLAPQVSYAHLGALHYFPPMSMSGHSNTVGTAFMAPRSETSINPSFASLEPVMLDVHGVLLAVCGLSVVAGQQGDPLARVHVPGDVERADLSLLLLHAPIEGLVFQEGGMLDSAFPEVARSTIAGQSSFGVILAGYHHGYRHTRVGRTDVVVAGATVGGGLIDVDFDDAENEPGFVFLGVAADGIRWCQHIPGETLRFRRLVIHTSKLWGDLTGGARSGEVPGHTPTDEILERLAPLCSADSIVQLRLVGQIGRDSYHQLDFGRIRSYGEEHCFDLAIDESELSLLPGETSPGRIAPVSDGRNLSVPDVNDVYIERMSRGNVILEPSALEEKTFHPEWNEGPGPEGSEAKHDKEMEERLSPRKELVNVADEWIEAAENEQEKRALMATKEELLVALDRMKTRSRS